jgi:hypothetical protein
MGSCPPWPGRIVVSERTMDGLAAARARGRPPAITLCDGHGLASMVISGPTAARPHLVLRKMTDW